MSDIVKNLTTKNGRLPAKLILGVIGAVIVIACGPLYKVPGYEHAVVTRGGKFVTTVGPGFHLRMPVVESVQFFDTSTQALNTPRMNTYTVDNQEVSAQVNVQFEIPASSLEWTYQNNRNYMANLEAMVANEWKVVAGGVNINQFAGERGRIRDLMEEKVRQDALKLYRLRVTYVGITDIQYDQTYRAAQSRANVIKTQVEQARGEQQKAEIDAATRKIEASGEANKAIEHARGEAESIKLKAEADSYAVRVNGEAAAQAQEAMAAALSKNASLVDYERARRWNGQLPQNVYAGAPIPFLQAGH